MACAFRDADWRCDKILAEKKSTRLVRACVRRIWGRARAPCDAVVWERILPAACLRAASSVRAATDGNTPRSNTRHRGCWGSRARACSLTPARTRARLYANCCFIVVDPALLRRQTRAHFLGLLCLQVSDLHSAPCRPLHSVERYDPAQYYDPSPVRTIVCLQTSARTCS